MPGVCVCGAQTHGRVHFEEDPGFGVALGNNLGRLEFSNPPFSPTPPPPHPYPPSPLTPPQPSSRSPQNPSLHPLPPYPSAPHTPISLIVANNPPPRNCTSNSGADPFKWTVRTDQR